MDKLLLSAAIVMFGMTPALAFGPSRSDAHPPGALFESTPQSKNPQGNMVNPPRDMRVMPSAEFRNSNVRLNTHARLQGSAVRLNGHTGRLHYGAPRRG